MNVKRYGCISAILLSLGIFAAAIWLIGSQVADIRDEVDAIRCAAHMRALHEQLVIFSESHDKLPVNADGQLDLEKILETNGVSDPSQYLCPSNPQFDCFIFREGLKPSDVSDKWNADIMMTIATDRPGNHVHSDRDGDPRIQSMQILSTNNCVVTTRYVTCDEAKKLAESVRKGRPVYDDKD